MKTNYFVLLLVLLFAACASPKQTSSPSVFDTLIGENEIKVLNRLGTPSSVIHNNNGGKTMVYAHVNDSPASERPATQNSTQNNRYSTPMGVTYSGKSSGAGASTSSSFQKSIKALSVYIDKQGLCYKVNNTLPQPQLDYYSNRLKQSN